MEETVIYGAYIHPVADSYRVGCAYAFYAEIALDFAVVAGAVGGLHNVVTAGVFDYKTLDGIGHVVIILDAKI